MWPNEERVLKVFEQNKGRMLFGITGPIDFSWDSLQKGAHYPAAGLQGTFLLVSEKQLFVLITLLLSI